MADIGCGAMFNVVLRCRGAARASAHALGQGARPSQADLPDPRHRQVRVPHGHLLHGEHAHQSADESTGTLFAIRYFLFSTKKTKVRYENVS